MVKMEFMDALQRMATGDPECYLLEGFMAGREVLPRGAEAGSVVIMAAIIGRNHHWLTV